MNILASRLSYLVSVMRRFRLRKTKTRAILFLSYLFHRCAGSTFAMEDSTSRSPRNVDNRQQSVSALPRTPRCCKVGRSRVSPRYILNVGTESQAQRVCVSEEFQDIHYSY
jgi:hypothetical protein